MFDPVQAHNPAAMQARAVERRKEAVRRSLREESEGPRVIEDEVQVARPTEAPVDSERDRALPHSQTQEDADDQVGSESARVEAELDGVEPRRLDLSA